MTTADQLKEQGNEAFRSGNYSEAVKFFTEAIELSPTNVVLYSNRSGAYANCQQYDKALEDGQKCIELDPSFTKGYCRKGLAEYRLGKIKESISTYHAGLLYDPNSEALKKGLQEVETNCIDMIVDNLSTIPKFKEYLKDTTYREQLYSTVSQILKDPQNISLALSPHIDPRVAEAVRLMFNIPGSFGNESNDASQKTHEKNTDNKKEEKEQQKLNRPRPEVEADEWKEKGNKLYSQRQFEEALNAYDKANELYPTNVTYLTNKAAVYLEMKEYDLCLSTCQEILDKRYEYKVDFEKIAKVYARMAVCYRRMEDYDNSIKMYEKCLTEHNHRHYRSALSETKDLREKKILENYINPELAEEHRLKGNEFFKKGLFPDSKKEYDEAIRRNPNDARLYANRSAALMKLSELPMALSDAEKSLELNPEVPKVWSRKGNIYMMMKSYNKSINAFQKGLSIDPNNYECLRGLEEISRRIQESTTSGQVDEDQIKHAMSDPEIQALLSDVQFSMILREISENPSKLRDALKDPNVASGIQKLMAAGILKMCA